MWGYPYRAADKRIKRCVHPHYRGISVITPLPCGRGVGGGAALSHVLLFLSQNYTEEQISQRHTETSSQPITQSITAHVSYNALWYLSSLAGVCGFPLLAERLLFICENLWEIKFPTSFLRSKICEKKSTSYHPKNLPLNTNHGARGKKRKLNYRCIVIDITSMPSRWKHN